jgi:hypothetical protein
VPIRKRLCDYTQIETLFKTLNIGYRQRTSIRHRNMQFIPEMGWIATFLWVICIKLAKHLIIRKDEKV